MSAYDTQLRGLQRAILRGGAAPGVSGHLPVYQHAVPARLSAALRDNFGVLPQLMGDDGFEALALAYQRAHPSRHPSIRWFGEALAAFMAERDDLVPHPAMADMARFEWALRTAFDAADATPLQGEDLGGLAAGDWPGLVLHLHPSVQAVVLQWAIAPAWRALQAGADAPEPEPYVHTVLVWRAGLATRWRSLDPMEATLLDAVAACEPFAALCERSGGPEAAVAALQQWLADGLLVRCSVPLKSETCHQCLRRAIEV